MRAVRLVVLLLILGAATRPALAECAPGAARSTVPANALSTAIQDAYKQQASGLKLPDPKVIDTRYDVGRLRNLFQHLDLSNLPPQFHVYAVISSGYQRSYREEILVSIDALICILRPLTSILISDGITHHYVIIDHIDELSGTAYIIDGWPKESFLISDELSEHERGRLENVGNAGVTIALPLATLPRYLIGAMFVETDDFVQQLALADSNLDKEPANLIALGLSGQRDDQSASFPKSVEMFRKAEATARVANDAASERIAKQEQSYALAMSIMKGGVTGYRARSYLQEFNKMQGEGFGFSSYTGDRLLSLGAVFLERRDVETASRLATLAINSSPDDERGYILRASTLEVAGRSDAALLDAQHAYRLNTELIRRVILVHTDDFVDKFFDQHGNLSIYKELSDRREAILFQLANIYSKKRSYDRLLAIAIETEKLQRGSSHIEGTIMRAEALNGLGRLEEARAIANDLYSKGNQASKRMLKSKLGGLLPN